MDSLEGLLERQWRSEQISGRLQAEGKLTVCHETIYQHVLKNKRACLQAGQRERLGDWEADTMTAGTQRRTGDTGRLLIQITSSVPRSFHNRPSGDRQHNHL